MRTVRARSSGCPHAKLGEHVELIDVDLKTKSVAVFDRHHRGDREVCPPSVCQRCLGEGLPLSLSIAQVRHAEIHREQDYGEH